MFNKIKSIVKYIKPLLQPVFINPLSSLQGCIYFNKTMNEDKCKNYENAEQYCKKAIHSLKKNHYNSLLHIWSLECMADIYLNTAQFGNAIKIIKKTGTIRKSVFGENHIEYGKYLYKLGSTYENIGQFKKGKKYLKKSLEVKKNYYGKEHKSMIEEYSILLGVYNALKNYEYVDKIYNKTTKLNKTTKYKGKIYKGNEEIVFYSYITSLNEQNKTAKAQKIICEKLNYYGSKYKIRQNLYIKKVNNLLTDYKEYLDITFLKNKSLEILQLKKHCFNRNLKKNIISLNIIGDCFYKEENYLQSEDIYKKALKIDPCNIDTIQGLSRVYYILGKYKECEEIIKKSLNENIENTDLPTKMKYLSLMDLLGLLYKNKKDYIKCEKIYLRALDMRNKTDINMNSTMITGLVWYKDENLNKFLIDKIHNVESISDFYYDLERFEESEEWYKNLLKEIEFYYGNAKNCNDSKYKALSRLTEIYKNNGEYYKALEYHELLCTYYRDDFGEKSEKFALQLHKLASLYHALGKEKEADENFKKSIDIINNIDVKNQSYYVQILEDAANVKLAENRIDEGLIFLEKALSVCKNIKDIDSKYYANIVERISETYIIEERYSDAEVLFKDELEIIQNLHENSNLIYAFLLKKFGDFFKKNEDYTNAEKYYIASEKSFKEENVIIKKPMEYIRLFENLGDLYRITGNLKKSKEVYTNLLEDTERILGKSSKKYHQICVTLSHIYWDIGDYKRSIELYEYTIEILEALYGKESITYIKSIRLLANFYNKVNASLKELSILNKALDLENTILIDGLAGANEAKKIEVLTEANIEFNKYLTVLVKTSNISEKYIYDAFDIVLLRKGMIFEMMIMEKDILLGGKYPNLKEELNNLNNLKLKIAEKVMYETEKENLQKLKIEKEKLENKIATNIPELELKLRFQKVKKEEVFKELKENDLLLEFVKVSNDLKEEIYIAFVVDNRGAKINIINLGEAVKIDTLVKKFTKSIIDGNKKFIAIGEELRKLLIDPLLNFEYLKKRIFICPDGELTKLPFHLLTYKSQYLFNFFEILYLNNSKDIIRKNILTKAEFSKSIVVANANYENFLEDHNHKRKVNLNGLQFNDLPYSKIEGLVISQKLGVNPYMGEEASIEIIKNANSPKILHIATHGYFILENQKLNEKPLLCSGLVLSRSKENDGILTAEDISLLNLMGTELLVLSACETAMGEVRNVEGIYGLRRAFSLVGVKTIIMSLWEIDDVATAILMKRFYENLIDKKMSSSIALKDAQIYIKTLTKKSIRQTLIQDGNCEEFKLCIEKWYNEFLKYDSEESKPFVDPYYWGGFICQGF